MKTKKTVFFLLLVLSLSGLSYGASGMFGEGDIKVALPLPLDGYGDSDIEGIWAIIKHRIEVAPFNLVATLLFFGAIIHTFTAGYFIKLSHKYETEHRKKIENNRGRKDSVCFKAELYHFLGEIEAIFSIWIIPLMVAIFVFYDWKAVLDYINYEVSYIEPVFVVIIMIMASTKPILKLAEQSLSIVASLGKHSPAAWWLSILIIAPLFGCMMTEPAAMTIAALLLANQFYDLKPSLKLAYATIGLLFVNVSVGGSLTHFASPPILVVARIWGWDTNYTFIHFGIKAFTGIVISTFLYYFIFRKEFTELKARSDKMKDGCDVSHSHAVEGKDDYPIPMFVTLSHVFFLVWTVVNLHYLPLIIGGFLFFLAFRQITLHHQFILRIRNPVLVGFFLAGLVTHGGLQQWWLQPVLNSLSQAPLFIGATILTAFNDNASITYLASQVPEFMNNPTMQNAVVSGAITGGGLTVIANAPNPAGQAILSHYFQNGVSPLKLFLGVVTPTIILSIIFLAVN